MEEVGGLVPVDPHTTEVVTEEVVERVSGEERETVRDPVCLVAILVEVRFSPLAKVSNRLSTLIISSRPDSQCNAVKCMRRVLLKDERVVNAMWLTAARANLNIVWETCLSRVLAEPKTSLQPHLNIPS